MSIWNEIILGVSCSKAPSERSRLRTEGTRGPSCDGERQSGMWQGWTCVSERSRGGRRAWTAGRAGAAADTKERRGSEKCWEARLAGRPLPCSKERQQRVGAGATHLHPRRRQAVLLTARLESPGPPRLLVAFSKGVQPLKDRQTKLNAAFYHLPALAALPPPDDLHPRDRNSRLLTAAPHGDSYFNCYLMHTPLPFQRVAAREAPGPCMPHHRGRSPNGAGQRPAGSLAPQLALSSRPLRSDVSCRLG